MSKQSSKKNRHQSTSQKTGRPQEISDEILINCVNAYWLHEAKGNVEVMQQAHIYAKIAAYANSTVSDLPKTLEGRHFSRNDRAKARIEELANTPSESLNIAAAYEPLDRVVLAAMTKQNLLDCIFKREEYSKQLYHLAASALEQHKSLSDQCDELRGENIRFRAELAEKNDLIIELKSKLLYEEARAKRYAKVLNQQIAPEAAKKLVDDIPVCGVTDDETLKKMKMIGTQSVQGMLETNMLQTNNPDIVSSIKALFEQEKQK